MILPIGEILNDQKVEEMSSKVQTYPLRLPVSLMAAVESLSEEDGTSMNQFVVSAVAEKVSAMNTAAFFEKHSAKADLAVFRRILNRKGREAPRPGDELPAK